MLGKKADRALENFKEIEGLLRQMELVHFLCCGSCLGAVRDDGFIPHDPDMDLAIVPSEAIPRFLDGVEELGFRLKQVRTPEFGFLVKVFKREQKIDLLFLYREGQTIWNALSQPVRYVYPVDVMLPPKPHRFLGVETFLPAKPQEYLALHYGDDWRTVKTAWNWKRDPLCVEKITSPIKSPMTGRANADSALLVHTQMNHPFRAGKGRPRDDDWLARRMELYLRYTVPSLARQTDRQFTIWLDCRAGSEGQLEPHLDGLLAAGVRVTFDRGAQLLSELPADVRHVYITRIDSDDLYAPDAIALIRRLHGEALASQFYRGYVCDLASGEIRRVALLSPPFYTLRFSRDEFTSAADLWPLLAPRPDRPAAPRGHSVVRERFSPVALPDARFCVLRHDTNTGGNIRGQRVTCPTALAEIRGRFALPIAVATA